MHACHRQVGSAVVATLVRPFWSPAGTALPADRMRRALGRTWMTSRRRDGMTGSHSRSWGHDHDLRTLVHIHLQRHWRQRSAQGAATRASDPHVAGWHDRALGRVHATRARHGVQRGSANPSRYKGRRRDDPRRPEVPEDLPIQGAALQVGKRPHLPLSAHRTLSARFANPLRRQARPATGGLVHVTGGAAWWRCRRPGASRSRRWWCSRTTWPGVATVRDGRGRPRRARRAGWGGRPAACRPTPTRRTSRPWSRPMERAAGAVTPRSTRTSSSRSMTP
jgi:hypothetical protein